MEYISSNIKRHNRAIYLLAILLVVLITYCELNKLSSFLPSYLKYIEKWNNGKIPVALIHPATAGHGLNLQEGGSTLVWFGLTWSLELYQQTNARLYRQGQNSDTVVIMHIAAKGTIDEQILKALKKKDSTQSALINAVKAEIGGRVK